ncbi:PREDICTED: CMT1A duplicated region transcript 4 protein-like, partial [Leptosomus discolor]|uniref:CMT1A duplicated region transcript 4 protein-like n=1 Tax=Leptosomus discolor TaxID=188344 RepID=UPI000522BCD7
YVLPSANMGLPSHLIQCHCPQPAYTTHTAPVVKMLIEQDGRRKATSNHPAEMEPNREPQEDDFEEETQGLSKLSGGSSTPGTGKDS